MHHLYDGQPPFAGLSNHLRCCRVLLTFKSCELFQNLHASLTSWCSFYRRGGRVEGIYEMEISTRLEASTRCRFASKLSLNWKLTYYRSRNVLPWRTTLKHGARDF
jgi:hypothetical protein